ncbi:DUF3499 domain-containing protein, partial [Jiangella rhizosphaerae]
VREAGRRPEPAPAPPVAGEGGARRGHLRALPDPDA